MADSIKFNDLACELAKDREDVQTWPRDRVRRWLNEEITVSADGAFKAGAALARLDGPVSGPEAVFAAGHLPAFLAFVEYLGAEEGAAEVAASLAILMFAAYAFGIPSVTLKSGDAMLSVSRNALDELRTRSWPQNTFKVAWDRYCQGKVPQRERRTVYDVAIVRAYESAAIPGVGPDLAVYLAFPFVAEWLLALPVRASELKRLLEIAGAFEEFCLRRRRSLRLTALAFR